MSGHTPGPLEIKPGAFSYQIDIKKGADCLATVYGNTGQNLGNAHLFAAAPDLLQALERAEESLCLAESLLDMHQDDSPNFEPAILAARAAIAKAKGEAE